MNIINYQLHSLSCHDNSSYHESRISQKLSRHDANGFGVLDISDGDEVAVAEGIGDRCY